MNGRPTRDVPADVCLILEGTSRRKSANTTHFPLLYNKGTSLGEKT